jgi:hypothetical protein
MSFRKFAASICFLITLAFVPMFAGGSKKGTQYAVLIAVAKYAKTDQWKPLPYTIDEMAEFQAVLLDTGFAKENVEFLHDKQTDDKLRPTAANLVKKIKLMLDEIGPELKRLDMFAPRNPKGAAESFEPAEPGIAKRVQRGGSKKRWPAAAGAIRRTAAITWFFAA